ncbi:MAG: hypothetical protein LBG26_00095 [Treponema sp.]|nr:hypothetical protein [Treponema sp.]
MNGETDAWRLCVRSKEKSPDSAATGRITVPSPNVMSSKVEALKCARKNSSFSSS